MDFQTMIDKVYIHLRDAPREFVDTAFVQSWLNEAQRDLAQRTKLLTKEITNLTAGAPQVAGGILPFPADFIDTTALRFGTDDVNFEVDEPDFWLAKDNGWSVSPPWGRLHGAGVEVFPAPANNAAYQWRYAYLPADLVNPGDISPFPVELQDKMVTFALSEALYREREDALADRKRQEYEIGLPQRTLGFGRSRPPQNRVRFEPGSFDLDPEAKHITL